MATTIPSFTSAEKTAHNSHKFGFTLTLTNYGYWKTMVQPFLVTNGLFGYVDGTIVCPPSVIQPPKASDKETVAAAAAEIPNPSHVAWVSNDAHVRMLLLSTISESSFQHVPGTTSRDLWLSLEHAYAPHTSSREFTLRTQLLKIMMKENESSAAYLTRAQEYSDALANIGAPMPEKDVVMLVISGLREEYNPLKSTILARQFSTAFNELHSLLADHDFMIRKTAPTSEIGPTQAFTATTVAGNTSNTSVQPEVMQTLQQLVTKLGLQLQPDSTSTPPSSQAYYTNRTWNNNRGRGGHRGRGGRTQNNNFNSYNRNQGGGVNRSSGQFSWASNHSIVHGTCNRCGIGHLPSQCPSRDPSTFRARQPSANYADYRSQASLWDTGTSDHVAQDMSGFDSAEPYYGGDNLHVGNGQMYTHYPPHGSK